jgi:hypothetical protein
MHSMNRVLTDEGLLLDNVSTEQEIASQLDLSINLQHVNS